MVVEINWMMWRKFSILPGLIVLATALLTAYAHQNMYI